MDIKLFEILGIFISVILGLSLMNTVSDYGASIANYTNSSEIVKSIAPFIGIIWLAGCFGLAGALGYGIYKRNK